MIVTYPIIFLNEFESKLMKGIGFMTQILSLIDNLPYAYVPEDVIEKLCQLPRNETLVDLKKLITLTQDRDLSDRAIDAILQIDPEFGKTVLLELRVRPEWEWFFCYASIDYGDNSFTTPLCDILLNSPNPNARYMAVIALKYIGDINAIDALTIALNDHETDHEGRKISRQAADALEALQKNI